MDRSSPILRYAFILTRSKVALVICHFPKCVTGTMSLDKCQNFVFVQYHENQLIEFHKILFMH